MKLLVLGVLVLVACANAGIIGGLGLGLAHGGIHNGAVLAGPSGTVVRSGLVAGPAVVAAPALGLGLGGLGLGLHGGLLAVPAGSGLEGQWIPDINEKLYDDGSYKPHIYGH